MQGKKNTYIQYTFLALKGFHFYFQTIFRSRHLGKTSPLLSGLHYRTKKKLQRFLPILPNYNANIGTYCHIYIHQPILAHP